MGTRTHQLSYRILPDTQWKLEIVLKLQLHIRAYILSRPYTLQPYSHAVKFFGNFHHFITTRWLVLLSIMTFAQFDGHFIVVYSYYESILQETCVHGDHILTHTQLFRYRRSSTVRQLHKVHRWRVQVQVFRQGSKTLYWQFCSREFLKLFSKINLATSSRFMFIWSGFIIWTMMCG